MKWVCDIGTCINKLYGRWVNNCEFIGMNKMVVNVWLLSASTATTVIFREWARARTTKRKRHGKDERIGEHAYKISFNWKFLLYAVFSVFFRWIIVTSFRLQRKRTHKAAHTIRRRSMNVSNTVTKTQMVDNKWDCCVWARRRILIITEAIKRRKFLLMYALVIWQTEKKEVVFVFWCVLKSLCWTNGRLTQSNGEYNIQHIDWKWPNIKSATKQNVSKIRK